MPELKIGLPAASRAFGVRLVGELGKKYGTNEAVAAFEPNAVPGAKMRVSKYGNGFGPLAHPKLKVFSYPQSPGAGLPGFDAGAYGVRNESIIASPPTSFTDEAFCSSCIELSQSNWISSRPPSRLCGMPK